MALRWYTTVIEANDIAAQARWWAHALGWQIAYESADEVVIVPTFADEIAESVPFDRVPPGLVFVPVEHVKSSKNRLHLDLACETDEERDGHIARWLAAGATRIHVGEPESASWSVFADPEGNEFCMLSARTA